MDCRVLVHSHDAQIFLLLRHILATEGFSVSPVANPDEAVDSLNDSNVIAILIDCSATSMDPSDLRSLKTAWPDIAIIIMGDRRDAWFDVEYADFALVRPFDPALLIGRFRRLRLDRLIDRGPAEKEANVLRFADLEMNIAAARVRRNGQEVALTALQFRLLRDLLRNPEAVRSREELIAAAWPAGSDVEPRTVDIHVGQIRRALMKFGPNLIRTVRAVGYALGLSRNDKL